MTILIILIIIVVILIVLLFTTIIHSRRFSSLSSQFKRKGQKGGLFISVISPADVDKMLDNNSVSIWDFAQCAAFNRKSCGAVSLIRSDLPPIAFIIPNSSETIGFIFNPEILFPLVTGMFIIDANTDGRSYCSNENGYDTGFQKINDRGTNDSADCEDSEENCKILNSGGGIDTFYLKNLESKCFDGSGGLNASDCSLCKKPYICKFNDVPNNPIGTKLQGNTFVQDKDIVTYIGDKGEKWVDLYANDFPLSAGKISTEQCKFLPKDWNGWINVLKSFYAKLLEKLRSGVDTGINPNFQYPSYIENEVNIYINPNKRKKDQNLLFLKSIVGVFYVANSCEEQIDDPSLPPVNVKSLCNDFYKVADYTIPENINKKLAKEKATALVSLLKTQGYSVDLYAGSFDTNICPSKTRLEQLEKGEIKFSDIFSKIPPPT